MTDDLLSLFDLLDDAFPTFDLAHLPPLIPFHSCDNKKSRSTSGCQEHCGTLTRGGNDNQTLILHFTVNFIHRFAFKMKQQRRRLLPNNA